MGNFMCHFDFIFLLSFAPMLHTFYEGSCPLILCIRAKELIIPILGIVSYPKDESKVYLEVTSYIDSYQFPSYSNFCMNFLLIQWKIQIDSWVVLVEFYTVNDISHVELISQFYPHGHYLSIFNLVMDQFVHGHNSQHYEDKEHNYLISQQCYNHYWHWSKEFVILALGQFHYFNLRKIAMKATLAKDGGVVRGIGGLK